MRRLANKPNVTAPDSDYPYARLRNRAGVVRGTAVDENTYGDIHQFFEKMFDASGIVANELPDNEYSGFQLYEALLLVIQSQTVGLLDFKGDLDASGNPNYPAASKGDVYMITPGGKVGGASGKVVVAGDMLIAKADNAGGTEGAVGASWFVVAEADITTPWIVGTSIMASGWAASGAPQGGDFSYKKTRRGTIKLKGAPIYTGTPSAGLVFTLPVGYRPPARIYKVISSGINPQALWVLEIRTNGEAYLWDVTTGFYSNQYIATDFEFEL